MMQKAQAFLGLEDDQATKLYEHLRTEMSAKIPYPFLPLQDCVNLATLLIETTTALQNFVIGIRGVGGPSNRARSA